MKHLCVTLATAAIAFFSSCKRAPLPQSDSTAAQASSAATSAPVIRHTFATTYVDSDRFSCGYPPNLIKPMIDSGNYFFVAISKEQYTPALCGRVLDITIHGFCGNADIDTGYCKPIQTNLGKKILGILTDVCPDPKKCISPSAENKERKHKVYDHLDIGPKPKVEAHLESMNKGAYGNYDISWNFSEATYSPKAYVMDMGNPYYFRIGLMISRGVKAVSFGTSTDKVFSHDGLARVDNNNNPVFHNMGQAEFIVNSRPDYLELIKKGGLPLRVWYGDDPISSPGHRYILTSGVSNTLLKFGAETLYEATLQEAK